MIDPSFIKTYLVKKFPIHRFGSEDTEFLIHSCFTDDYKYHMSINLESGLWQDFKTGKTGNFIQLYAILEGIPYKVAHRRLTLINLFTDKPIQEVRPPENADRPDLSVLKPLNMEAAKNDPFAVEALMYLDKRKLLDDKLEYFYITEGSHANRIAIPFKNSKGEVYYYQSRSIDPEAKPKYLFPETRNSIIRAGNLLYQFDRNKNYVVVCEGIVDAISLQLMGINATCVNGCHVSETQAETLDLWGGIIILGFDNDEAGERGIREFDKLRRLKRMPSFSVLTPPDGCKDWNDVLVKGLITKDDYIEFINEKPKQYDTFYRLEKELSLL